MKIEIEIESVIETLKMARRCIQANKRHVEDLGRYALSGTNATLDEIDNCLKYLAEKLPVAK